MQEFLKKKKTYFTGLNRFLTLEPAEKLLKEASEKQIPAVRETTARLLYFTASMSKSRNALEIGTGSGLSSLWILKALNSEGKLTTLERDKNRFEAAKLLFADEPRVTLLYEDAFNFLKNTSGTYDFIFLDAQKRDYIDFLPLLENRILTGGILFTDNVLFGGKVIEMTEEEKIKYTSGVERLKLFNQTLSENPSFETLFLDVEDGVVVSRKKG